MFQQNKAPSELIPQTSVPFFKKQDQVEMKHHHKMSSNGLKSSSSSLSDPSNQSDDDKSVDSVKLNRLRK